MHEKYIKMHVKCAKIKQIKTNSQIIKQAKHSSTRQGVPNGVAIIVLWSLGNLMACESLVRD
jgi:hypothetical protein